MSQAFVIRERQLFGGLVVPRVTPGFKVGSSELVDFLKGRLRERAEDRNEVFTVYIPDSTGQSNVLVCFAYESTDEIPFGDVFALVPKGIYAVFKPNGEYSDPIEDLWVQAKAAADLGSITRAYGAEMEIFHRDGSVELLISVAS